MARIRTIKPEFFRHEGLFEAEQETGLPLRVAFAGLWTAADREGRFEWKPRTLKLDCLPYDDVDFAGVLDALETRGFIVRYACGTREYGYVPSWHHHQAINNREKESDIPAPSERVDDASGTREERAFDVHQRKGREGKGSGVVAREDRDATTTLPDLEFERKKREWAEAIASVKHAPSALDIEPLVALESRGYDWSKDIMPALRSRVASGRLPANLTSAKWFVPIIEERHAIPQKPQAPPTIPKTWVSVSDPRWPELAEAQARATGKPCQPIESKHQEGKGRYFDDDVIARVLPAEMKRAV